MAHVEQSSAVLRVLRTSTEVARKGAVRFRVIYFAGLGSSSRCSTIGGTMSIGFSNIDDHEQMGWVGPDGRVPTARLADILLSAEVGYAGRQYIAAGRRPADVDARNRTPSLYLYRSGYFATGHHTGTL